VDSLLGALVAAGVAWLSIAVAALLPVPLPVRRLRWAGAASIALVGLTAMGLPVPAWVPVAALAAGLALGLALPGPSSQQP
jgi:hypothetical protein